MPNEANSATHPRQTKPIGPRPRAKRTQFGGGENPLRARRRRRDERKSNGTTRLGSMACALIVSLASNAPFADTEALAAGIAPNEPNSASGGGREEVGLTFAPNEANSTSGGSREEVVPTFASNEANFTSGGSPEQIRPWFAPNEPNSTSGGRPEEVRPTLAPNEPNFISPKGPEQLGPIFPSNKANLGRADDTTETALPRPQRSDFSYLHTRLNRIAGRDAGPNHREKEPLRRCPACIRHAREATSLADGPGSSGGHIRDDFSSECPQKRNSRPVCRGINTKKGRPYSMMIENSSRPTCTAATRQDLRPADAIARAARSQTVAYTRLCISTCIISRQRHARQSPDTPIVDTPTFVLRDCDHDARHRGAPQPPRLRPTRTNRPGRQQHAKRLLGALRQRFDADYPDLRGQQSSSAPDRRSAGRRACNPPSPDARQRHPRRRRKRPAAPAQAALAGNAPLGYARRTQTHTTAVCNVNGPTTLIYWPPERGVTGTDVTEKNCRFFP